jgi:hypothetical protein
MGVYKSAGEHYSFGATPIPVFVESVSCLQWTTTGVYVCGAPDGKVSYVGFAKDVSMISSGGLTRIMRADQIKGEPPCCSGAAVTACNWMDDCQRLGACADAGGAALDASCAGDAGADPGRPEAGGAGGGAAGAGGSSSGAGGAPAGSAGSDTGTPATCQCDLPTRRDARPYGGAIAFLTLIIRRLARDRCEERKGPRRF